jgi:acetyl esterase/lipase
MTRSLLQSCLVVLALASAGFSAEFRSNIEYGEAAGEKLLVDASIPDGKGPFPVAILVHGGGWGGGDKAVVHVPPMQPFNDAGFTWFSIDYRLAPKHRWPACIDDVRTAIRWVKEHAAEFKGDPNRIVLVGYSAGGHLAAYAVATADDTTRVQGLVVFAGPTDLVADCERRGEVSPALQALFDHGPDLDAPIREKLADASPLNFLTDRMPPTLLIHGTKDLSVPYSQSVVFQEKMKDLKVSCELITIPEGEHRLRDWERLNNEYPKKTVDWLNEHINKH